ncbi:unnamed protein product, partial [Didymodactylos carnosus]
QTPTDDRLYSSVVDGSSNIVCGSGIDQLQPKQQQQQKTTIYCGRHLRLRENDFLTTAHG